MKVHQIKIDFNITEQIKRYVYVYLIESKNLYIRQAEEELHSQKISSDTKAYLSDKICAKADERARAEILLEKYLSRLSSIGGSLNSFPNSSSSQQKRHKKQLKRKK